MVDSSDIRGGFAQHLRRDRSAESLARGSVTRAYLSGICWTRADGFAQVTLLLALAAIAAVLTASLATSRGASRQAASLEQLARGEARAESGFQRLLAAFADPADELEAVAFAGDAQVSVGGVPVTLRIEAEGSKIDVLEADRSMVARYLEQNFVVGGEIASVLAALEADRSRADATAASLLLELALVGGLDLGQMRRDLTRFGGKGIDPQYASERVLRAVPDLTLAEADRIAALGPSERASFLGRSSYFASGGRHFTLVAEIDGDGGGSMEWHLPIEISTAGKAIVLAGAYR